mgnify:CR=1 FL=1
MNLRLVSAIAAGVLAILGAVLLVSYVNNADSRAMADMDPVRLARSIALGAAQEGAREGRVQPASTARAESAAEGFLDQTASDLLTGRTVAVAGSPTSIEVTVTGTSISLFPGLSGWAVTQSAVGPVERPTP